MIKSSKPDLSSLQESQVQHHHSSMLQEHEVDSFKFLKRYANSVKPNHICSNLDKLNLLDSIDPNDPMSSASTTFSDTDSKPPGISQILTQSPVKSAQQLEKRLDQIQSS